MGFRLTGPGSEAELRYRRLAKDAHAHAAARWSAGDYNECQRFLTAARFFRERADAVGLARRALLQWRKRKEERDG
jgi:hypothetical protein